MVFACTLINNLAFEMQITMDNKLTTMFEGLPSIASLSKADSCVLVFMVNVSYDVPLNTVL